MARVSSAFAPSGGVGGHWRGADRIAGPAGNLERGARPLWPQQVDTKDFLEEVARRRVGGAEQVWGEKS